jgi:hypothetical protein
MSVLLLFSWVTYYHPDITQPILSGSASKIHVILATPQTQFQCYLLQVNDLTFSGGPLIPFGNL